MILASVEMKAMLVPVNKPKMAYKDCKLPLHSLSSSCLEFGASHQAQLSHWHPESLCSSQSDCAVLLPLLITVADSEGLLAGSSREPSLIQDRSKCGCSDTLIVE